MARPLPLNPWLLAPLLALAGLGLTAWQRAQVPTRADWRAATDAIRAELAPGDGVTWAPAWAGEGRLFFAGLPAFHLEDVTQPDFARYDRVWLLGAFGYGGGRLPPEHAVLQRRSFGPLELALVQAGGPKVVGDLYAHLEEAAVSREYRDGRRQACDFWDGRGWHCELKRSPEDTRSCLAQPTRARLNQRRRSPNDADCGLNPWVHVARDVRVIGGEPRRCLWMHPLAEATVILEWPAAPAGESLVVDYGFIDTAVSDHDRPQPRVKPAHLRVERGDAAILELPIPVEWGWRRSVTPLGGEAGPLRLRLTTESTTDAWLCLDPTLRGPR